MSRVGTIVNIAGTTPVDDPEYRYKMPLVYGKIEGRGNGIKTVIPNISDVGLSLHRDPGEVNKFFGCELGAQTSYSDKTDRAVVNGAHTDAVLQNMMHRYIEKFVLCPSCGLPETEYKIKGGVVFHRCAACGAKDMVDMSHKLCTYILAQAKKNKTKKDKKDKKGEKVEGEKKEKKSKKKDKEKDRDSSDDDKKKKKKKKEKKKEKKDKKKKREHKDEDDLAEAVEDLSVASEAGVDDSGAMDIAVEETKKYLQGNSNATPAEIAEVVVNQQMASALKSYDKIHIFVRASIDPATFFKEKQIQTHAPTIHQITQGNPIMERHLIAALEWLCLGENAKYFPVMIKQMFEEDVLEEDVILEWAGEGRSDFTLESVDEEARAELRGEAEPVINWLQDDDSSDEEDDD